MSNAEPAGPTHPPLAGRRALVTGGSRNLGAAIAIALADAGATVAVTYHRSDTAANELMGELHERTGVRHLAIAADLSQPSNVTAACDRAAGDLGGLEIVVNNYGPFSMTPLHQLPLDEWQQVWGGNVETAYLAAAAAAPWMRLAGWGRIVNVSAGSAYARNHSVYGLAKDAIITLTETLAVELGPTITANSVVPGQIAESSADMAAVDPDAVERMTARTPAGRLVTRAEVAQLVALVCTRPFDMMTGAAIPLDGGCRFDRL